MSALEPVRLVTCSCGLPAEEHLTHYVVVRRDLPFGMVLAQVTHAAGESFYKLAHVAQKDGGASHRAEQRILNPQVAGSTPAVGSNSFPGSSAESASGGPSGPSVEVAGAIPAPGAFNPSETYAIVLGARNEGKLLKLEQTLLAARVAHVSVREPDAPYNGALMSVGLCPAPKGRVFRYVNEFHMLRELDPPQAS